ncbi:MAG: hypothetical protein OK457_06715 [Thaumarchaeota archaeon]|nr:hypothetical protein [Nitrososphaerota archaeon]
MENVKAESENSRRRIRPAVTIEKASKRKKNFVPAKTRAPASTSPEVAILSILERSPLSGIRTHVVLQEIKTKWFPELTGTDKSAIYPASRKKIVDSIIKFAKKHLIMKGQVFPPSSENPVGIWRVTSLGIERAQKENGSWVPKYVDVHSLIEAEE